MKILAYSKIVIQSINAQLSSSVSVTLGSGAISGGIVASI